MRRNKTPDLPATPDKPAVNLTDYMGTVVLVGTTPGGTRPTWTHTFTFSSYVQGTTSEATADALETIVKTLRSGIMPPVPDDAA